MYQYTNLNNVDMVYAMEGYSDTPLENDIAMEGALGSIREKLKAGIAAVVRLFVKIGKTIKEKVLTFINFLLRRGTNVSDSEEDSFEPDDEEPSNASTHKKIKPHLKSRYGSIQGYLVDQALYQEWKSFEGDFNRFRDKIATDVYMTLGKMDKGKYDDLRKYFPRIEEDYKLGDELDARQQRIKENPPSSNRIVRVSQGELKMIEHEFNSTYDTFNRLSDEMQSPSDGPEVASIDTPETKDIVQFLIKMLSKLSLFARITLESMNVFISLFRTRKQPAPTARYNR